ncbi:hypothetical protein ACFPH6_29490 [Streptomyces xiangluensis]|uniref:AsnC-type helix-turn-helix domain-containing protein n=1 Tax=Streptomyces xiangluensis TaxID=2665720 RepID=A0ABV8YZS5_9ACTN
MNALQIHPRASWTLVGDVLGVNPVTAARRWRRLKEAGLAWVTAYPRLSDSRIVVSAVVEVDTEPGAAQDVARALATERPRPGGLDASPGPGRTHPPHHVLVPDDTGRTGHPYPSVDGRAHREQPLETAQPGLAPVRPDRGGPARATGRGRTHRMGRPRRAAHGTAGHRRPDVPARTGGGDRSGPDNGPPQTPVAARLTGEPALRPGPPASGPDLSVG